MNVEVVTAAIKRAIEQGAVAAPPIPGQSEDENYVRAQTDVGIDPHVLATYVASLRADPDMAEFDSRFASMPLGGGSMAGLSSVGKLLLAQAVTTGDVEGTVRRFASYLASNAAEATAVMAVSGIKTREVVKLGPDVSLVPLKSVSPSSQRAAALGKGTLAFLGPRFPIPSALTTDFIFRPVFYNPNEPQPREGTASEAKELDRIPSSLSFSVDLTKVKTIRANSLGGCFQGQTHAARRRNSAADPSQ